MMRRTVSGGLGLVVAGSACSSSGVVTPAGLSHVEANLMNLVRSTVDTIPQPLGTIVEQQRFFSQRRSSSDQEEFLNIGDVKLPITHGIHPERVPRVLPDAATTLFPASRSTMGYLRWMAQKELLNQDICIVGDPGPSRRWLVLTYAFYAKREVQTLCLSRDTTEADLKQRKEITNGTLRYEDQAVVSAALNGHLLILEGLERAERNVLPVINNLLENREMHLDNGMMLIHPARYDQLCAEHKTNDLTHLGVLRVSEHFRVLALTVPVPKYPGNPLDPPLRSRFQCLYLHPPTGSENPLWSGISHTTSAEAILKFKQVISSSEESGKDRDRSRQFPDFGDFVTLELARQHALISGEAVGNILMRCYPWKLYARKGPRAEIKNKEKEIRQILSRYSLLPKDQLSVCVTKISRTSEVTATVALSDDTQLSVSCGASSDDLPNLQQVPHFATFTDSHKRVFQEMLQSHACNRHMLIVGPSGCGKTAMVREFSTALGYDVETQHLFADMSSRDLLQRRTTDPKTGNTAWDPSGLILAARYGKLAILDGIDQLPEGMLSVLQELLIDGSISLFDGSVFKSAKDYDAMKMELGIADEEMHDRKIHRIHPSFRVIGTARLPVHPTFWFSSEVPTMFNVIQMNELESDEVSEVLYAAAVKVKSQYGDDCSTTEAHVAKMITGLTDLHDRLIDMSATDPKIPLLTLRQMIRVTRYATIHPDEIEGAIHSALLLPLVTQHLSVRIKKEIVSCGLSVPKKGKKQKKTGMMASMIFGDGKSTDPSTELHHGIFDEVVQDNQRHLSVAGEKVLTLSRKYDARESSLVPHVHNFYPNQQHKKIITWVAKNYSAANKILLVGNQGVGKNKIVDYFLSHAEIPRHYLQLHRDTTVTSLTINPSVIDGKVIWEDSPLVKAVMYGHALVIDEVDKAPIEVVQTLKGLIEDEEMKLGDGRKIVAYNATNAPEDAIRIHPDFRMIFLANPPGFPFHGNDFYRQCGDLFACYVMQNPDIDSQVLLLSKYGPSVPKAVIEQLVVIFQGLGSLFEEGAVQYPFSLRELIAVVRHLEAFPQDGIFQALNNVFNFDITDGNTMDHVRRLIHKHLRANAAHLVNRLATEVPLQEIANILQLEVDGKIAEDDTGDIEGLAVPATFTEFSYSEKLDLPINMDSFPALLSSAVKDPNEGFSENLATVSLSFLGASDKALQMKVLSDRGLVCFLVEDAEDNKLELVTISNPGAESLGHRAPALGPGKTMTIDLSSVIPREDAAMIELLGSVAGSSSVVTITNKRTGDIVFVDPLSGDTTLNKFYGKKGDIVPVSVCTTLATDGLLLVHQNGGNQVIVWLVGKLVCITLPEAVQTVSALSSQVFHIVFSHDETRDALLKLSVFHNALQCTRYNLGMVNSTTKKIGGVLTGREHGDFIASAGAVNVSKDISGAVFVPSNSSGSLLFGVTKSATDVSAQSEEGVVARNTLTITGYGSGSLPSSKGDVLSSLNQSTHQLSLVDTSTGKVSIVNTQRKTSRAFAVPAIRTDTVGSTAVHKPLLDVGTDGGGAVLGSDGRTMTSFDSNATRLQERFSRLTTMLKGAAGGLGAAPTPQELSMYYSKPKKAPSGTLKHGKEDPDNTPHVGGNTWAGGTGGTDTAGLGGLVGPYRLDKGHTVHQVSPEEKKKVPQHIIDEAKKMGKAALEKRLKEIGMTNAENEQYRKCYENVRGQVHQLQAMFSGLKAREGERVWLKHQSDGVWDDAKIVEGITGEKNIYKKRSDGDANAALTHKKKKRLLFVLDVSASMYRFNSMDGRLSRLVEAAVMVMESFVGHEDKIDYAMVGHSGDSDSLPLVNFGNPPANKKERMDICLKMVAYSQHCWTGDNTVRAMRKSVSLVTDEDGDSYFVFVISDANLAQYGITTSELSSIIRADERVNMYCIFIASFGAQASQLQSRLPSGHGFECMDTAQLPIILKQIFAATDLLNA